MALLIPQAIKDMEKLSLASLYLNDDPLCITLPAEINFWEHREEDTKEQAQRLAQALEQTKKRWSWFLEAGIIDNEKHTSLGTLGYLPLEIRLKIYIFMFNTQIRYINPHWGDFYVVPRWRKYLMNFTSRMLKPRYYWWMHFCYEACAFGCWDGKGDGLHTRPSPLNVKSYLAEAETWTACLETPILGASHSLRDEFCDWLISSRDFHFNCPASFAEFLHKLSSSQVASLRRITIDLTGPVSMKGCIEKATDPEAWKSAFEDLPLELSTLKQVTLLIGEDAKSFLDERGALVAWYHDEENRVGETLRPLYDIGTVANLVGIVSTRIHKVAPTAVFYLPEAEYLDRGKQGENQLKIAKAIWKTGEERILSSPFTPELSRRKMW